MKIYEWMRTAGDTEDFIQFIIDFQGMRMAVRYDGKTSADDTDPQIPLIPRLWRCIYDDES